VAKKPKRRRRPKVHRCHTAGRAGGPMPAKTPTGRIEKTKKHLNQFLFSTLFVLKNKLKSEKTPQHIQIKLFINIRKNEKQINYFCIIK
jgi:hypothetical protein